jgi:exonuclease III
MNWNIRGINSEKKWLALASKIDECGYAIICIQETKREDFYIQFIRNFAPKKFNKFEFLPSIGASGGIIIFWNGSLFQGSLEFQNELSISVKFISNMSKDTWILTNIYGPCHAEKSHIPGLVLKYYNG